MASHERLGLASAAPALWAVRAPDDWPPRAELPVRASLCAGLAGPVPAVVAEAVEVAVEAVGVVGVPAAWAAVEVAVEAAAFAAAAALAAGEAAAALAAFAAVLLRLTPRVVAPLPVAKGVETGRGSAVVSALVAAARQSAAA
mmetsp:Transcript_11655/g.26876  ORF Transcript_11655/g.26876 Transcript_11655/m.26876 type:complete len:143 (+) Transcript_11655:1616-2044(+)